MNMQHSSHGSFNGTFDEALRKALREKRRLVGVSLEQLGDFLQVHWSTVRKWESGVTTMCQPRHVALVIAFLNGDFDRELRRKYGLEVARSRQSSLPRRPFQKKLSRSFPSRLKEQFIQELERLFAKVLRDCMAQTKWSDDLS